MSNKLKIHVVKPIDIKSIFEFEKNNREFFESVLPPRPDTYHQLDSFEEVMKTLLQEQDDETYYMFLIEDEMNQIIGRVNLSVSESNDIKEAEVGYRIGKKHQGKGYASQSVKLVIDYAFDKLGLNQVSAGTATTNIASKRVLEKNGFTMTSVEKNVMKINNEWVDGSLFLLKNLKFK
jgi:ribosomal-protein-alanine N-acetyltransferase